MYLVHVFSLMIFVYLQENYCSPTHLTLATQGSTTIKAVTKDWFHGIKGRGMIPESCALHIVQT